MWKKGTLIVNGLHRNLGLQFIRAQRFGFGGSKLLQLIAYISES